MTFAPFAACGDTSGGLRAWLSRLLSLESPMAIAIYLPCHLGTPRGNQTPAALISLGVGGHSW
eukprot:6891086-Pyramimonas_sp.AAC.1